jgi:mannose/cellobiose epimerase-like protein (N-acyl-D-glucosamine 2-epimerase family)
MRAISLAAALAALFGPVGRADEAREQPVTNAIDTRWHETNLRRDADRWLSAVRDNGFCAVAMDARWRPAERQVATLVSQSRVIVDLAVAYEVTGEQAHLDAAERAGAFLLERFADAEHGGWFWSVDPAGAVVEDHKEAYGHAFGILAMATLHRVSGDARYAAAAREAVRTVRRRLVEPNGGLRFRTTADWTDMLAIRSQNPVMHYFEALLAALESTGDPAILTEARRVLGFMRETVIHEDPTLVVESFDVDWRAVESRHGLAVDVGHQFEWAFLLSEAARLGVDEPQELLATGAALIDSAVRLGYDRSGGGAFRTAYTDGTVEGREKIWWVQAELWRAMLRYAVRHGRDDLWPMIVQTRAFVDETMIDHEHGGWWESVLDGRANERHSEKGTIWKCGYHEMNLYREALRLADEGP